MDAILAVSDSCDNAGLGVDPQNVAVREDVGIADAVNRNVVGIRKPASGASCHRCDDSGRIYFSNAGAGVLRNIKTARGGELQSCGLSQPRLSRGPAVSRIAPLSKTRNRSGCT